MNNLILFIIESGICMAALYGMYWLFLRKETYFKFNRSFLLTTVIFASIIPLINFSPLDFRSETSALAIITGMGEINGIPSIISVEGANTVFNPSHLWLYLIAGIYLIGVLFIIIRIILGLFRVAKLKKDGDSIKYEGYSVVNIKRNLAPFSFFRTIFINESSIDSSQRNFIIDHELAHVNQKHTYDNLFVEITLALFWFNPFMWLIRRSLRHTHEYLADNNIKNTNGSLEDYQVLLLQQINGFSPLSVSNNFNSMIKSRIKIMCRSNSALPARLKPLLIVPVALCLTLIFACSYLETDLRIDNLKAGQTEVVLDIEDLRNLTAEEQTKCFESRKQPQHHDVEVYRVSSTAYATEEENDFGEWEGYEILFYISDDGTLRKGPFIAAGVNEDYDKAYYHWQNDTVLVRLENSRTEKEYARFRGTFPEDGSSRIETLQDPEHGIYETQVPSLDRN